MLRQFQRVHCRHALYQERGETGSETMTTLYATSERQVHARTIIACFDRNSVFRIASTYLATWRSHGDGGTLVPVLSEATPGVFHKEPVSGYAIAVLGRASFFDPICFDSGYRTFQAGLGVLTFLAEQRGLGTALAFTDT